MAVSEKTKVVGAEALRLDAIAKLTGKTKYGQDLFRKEFLFARLLRAAHPHAEIVSIDTRAALKAPGVVCVLTHKNVPGTNLHGLIRRDQEVLASKRVRYLGDAVALAVGRSEAAALEAIKKIRVKYKPLPAGFTVEEALKPGAPKIHPEGNVLAEKHIRKGNAPEAMDQADVVVEDVIQTQSVDHAFLELEAGRARYNGRTLTIEAPGQWIHEERRLIALALGLPLERVRIIQPATGGAFGGREDISIQIYLGLAALKAKGSTVCLRYSRAESMTARHKRHPVRIDYKLGSQKDGTLVAAEVTVCVDKGAYASTGVAVMRKASSHATGPYRIPNVWVDVVGVFTNKNPCGAMRGFGAAQMAIAYEGLMDRLAAEIGMDKAELRLKNLVRSGDAVTTGQVVPHATAAECFEAVLQKMDWTNRSYASPAPHLRRGYGVSVICFGLGYGDGFPDASRARCRLTKEGAIEVYSGGIDVGQGLTNMVAQIAAEEIGVPLDRVIPILADTQLTPESGSSSATRQTYFTGSAVQIAAAELKKQLQDIAAARLQELVYDIRIEDGEAYNAHRPQKRMSLKEIAREGAKRGFSMEGLGIIIENPDPGGPFGARGVGEPPLIGAAPAVLSAIHDAIGKPIRVLPATPERIWRTLINP